MKTYAYNIYQGNSQYSIWQITYKAIVVEVGASEGEGPGTEEDKAHKTFIIL